MYTQVSYIDSSVNIDPAITGKIAFSSDGTNWDFVSKENLTVGGIHSGSPGMNYPYPTKTLIVLKWIDKTITFEAQAVKNQPTWTAGTKASLQIAKQDISNF